MPDPRIGQTRLLSQAAAAGQVSSCWDGVCAPAVLISKTKKKAGDGQDVTKFLLPRS